VDVSGAIDVARHPRVATLELLLGRQSPFRTSPSRAEKLLFTSSLSRCLTPTKVSMSQLLQFSRLNIDVRNETKTDDPQVVSINECIHVAREIIITESACADISLCLSLNQRRNIFKRSPSSSAGAYYTNQSQRFVEATRNTHAIPST